MISDEAPMDQYLVEGAAAARLYQEYMKYGTLVIGFDFDGTVHDFHKTGASHEMVRELLRNLKTIGCRLVCWTAYKDLEYVKQFCIENRIPYDSINEGGIDLGYESKKPFFSALLDDRAGLREVYIDLKALVSLISKQMGYQSIKDLEQLRELANNSEGVEVFIALQGGLRSSKTIYYSDKLWTVYNHIDDSEDEGLKDGQLKTETNIVDALEKGALYLY